MTKNLPAVHLLALEGVPIFEQLQLEEALLRAGSDNICILNHKSTPAIVMGISGKPEELVDFSIHQKNPIPIIRRFSGGGCVLISHETLFLTFICNKEDVDIGTCPQRLLKWTEELLNFPVRENDYVFGDKKFGGNAQYFTKNRWLHHTSLLWDYSEADMQVLKMPPKMPDYRKSRPHSDFLCRLKDHFPSKEQFFSHIKASLAAKFHVIPKTAQDFNPITRLPHRKATELIRNTEHATNFDRSTKSL